MKVRPLILSNIDLGRLREYAEINRFSFNDLLEIRSGNKSPAGDDPNFSQNIPVGYKVVFTYEQHPDRHLPDTYHWLKHLSVSVDEANCYPNEAAVDFIMKQLNFKNSFDKCHVYIENLGAGFHAINILEKE